MSATRNLRSLISAAAVSMLLLSACGGGDDLPSDVSSTIEASLSTFSAHIANIASMDRMMSAPSLVLLDEVGSGTDPVEGGALGVAIVDHFRRRGATIVATRYAVTTQTATLDALAWKSLLIAGSATAIIVELSGVSPAATATAASTRPPGSAGAVRSAVALTPAVDGPW